MFTTSTTVLASSTLTPLHDKHRKQDQTVNDCYQLGVESVQERDGLVARIDVICSAAVRLAGSSTGSTRALLLGRAGRNGRQQLRLLG